MKDVVGFALKVWDRSNSLIKYGRHNHRDVFSKIYHNRMWGDQESVSGFGSRMVQTEHIRRELPRIIQQHGVKKLFDAPCGDLNWMRLVLEETKVDYEGGDIVPEVVELAKKNSPNPAFTFSVFDIVRDSFPIADLWLCRDVLFHLSFDNIWKVFRNFVRSEISYVLLTTHTSDRVRNRDILNGDFRETDFFKPPFSLPPTLVIERFPDYADDAPPRDMVLFKREDLALHLSQLREGV
jgi:SAM-dependent methyltransferase